MHICAVDFKIGLLFFAGLGHGALDMVTDVI